MIKLYRFWLNLTKIYTTFWSLDHGYQNQMKICKRLSTNLWLKFNHRFVMLVSILLTVPSCIDGRGRTCVHQMISLKISEFITYFKRNPKTNRLTFLIRILEWAMSVHRKFQEKAWVIFLLKQFNKSEDFQCRGYWCVSFEFGHYYSGYDIAHSRNIRY